MTKLVITGADWLDPISVLRGNSVRPPPIAVLARANDPWQDAEREAVAA